MRTSSLTLLRCACVVAATLLLGDPALATDEVEVRSSIANLSNDDCAVRDGAQTRLEAMAGADESGLVDRLLGEAAHSIEPEQAARAQAILERVHFADRLVMVRTRRFSGALDLERGDFAWSRRWNQAPADELWISGTGRRARIYELSEKRGLSQLDPASGERVWTTGKLCKDGAQIGQRWVFLEWDGLDCRSLDDGTAIWRLDVAGGSLYQAAHTSLDAQRCLVVDVGSRLTAIAIADGKVRWSRGQIQCSWVGQAEGGLFAIQWPPNTREARHPVLVRIDPDTGKDLWQSSLSMDAHFPIVFDAGALAGVLLVGTEDDRDGPPGIAIDPQTGEPRWVLPKACGTVQVESTGTHALVGMDDLLARVDLATGEIVASLNLPFHVAAIGEDGDRVTVLVCNQYGYGVEAMAYKAGTFDQLWHTVLESDDPRAMRDGLRQVVYDGSLRPIGDRLVVIRDSANGEFVEVLDRQTGALLHRCEPTKR